MNESEPFRNIMIAFAHHGFKKASMVVLAQAAEVSRQTLYNRFQTKDAVLGWAVKGYVEARRLRALEDMKHKHACVSEALLNGYCRWLGDDVVLVHESPHGAEILEMGTSSLRRDDDGPTQRFEQDVAAFLQNHGLCNTPQEAEGKAFVLMMSAHGLFIKARSYDEFKSGMSRIIGAAF